MILKLKAIKQIIKEELEKVVNEDLYADEDEYKEAIKDFMELHNVSREEAKKAIDAAGDEMDESHPEFATSVEEEKENIKAFETLMTLARKGKNLHGKQAYLEMQELRDLSMDFKNNLQNYFKKNEYYKIVYKGYEFCKTYMFDKHGFWDKAADAYGKLNKPLLQRDIGAAITMAKLEPQLQADIDERTEKCEETLAFALSYVEEQIIKDREEAEYQARRKKEKEDREKAKNELIKKGIPEEYVSAAIKAGTVLQDALKWDMDKWEEWMEEYRQWQMEKSHREFMRNQAWYDYMDSGRLNDPDYFTESKFRLTQNEIKQIIKEELEAVINEDLYADEEEYEQAIKDFMELHNVSREEAKQAIDAAGDEMDKDHPMFGRYIEKEKQDIKDYGAFKKYARKGQSLMKDVTPGSTGKYTEEDVQQLIYDFKTNKEKYKKNLVYKQVFNGYEYCLKKTSTMDVREPRGEKDFSNVLSDFGTELAKTKEPLMTRDLTAANRMRKSEKELQQLIDKRNAECEEKLGFALVAANNRDLEDERRDKIHSKTMQDRYGEPSNMDAYAQNQGFLDFEHMVKMTTSLYDDERK